MRASNPATANSIGWTGSTDTTWATAGNWNHNTAAPANDLTSDIARFDLTTYTNQPNAGTTSVSGALIGDGTTITGRARPVFSERSAQPRLLGKPQRKMRCFFVASKALGVAAPPTPYDTRQVTGPSKNKS